MSTTLSIEAQEQLARWSAKARALFTELLEDATGALQRELLQRSVAAGHTPAEVHAFADAIRGLDDSHAYAACTLEVTAPADFTVTQLLRAEADPLFAYELNGGALEPGDEPPAPAALEQPHPPRLDLLVAPPRRKRAFQADSGGVTPRLMAKPDAAERAAPPPSSLAFTEALLAEATRGLAVAWREHDVDAPGGLVVAAALEAATTALTQGMPVPCIIGPAPGQHRRFIVLLQVSTAGRTRAFQLYDPTSRELCWANERDLVLGQELPFDDKVNRRLTRVVLPTSLRSAF